MGVAVRYWDTQWFAHPSFCMTTFVFFCLERVFFFFSPHPHGSLTAVDLVGPDSG